jgi:hypothetical protein
MSVEALSTSLLASGQQLARAVVESVAEHTAIVLVRLPAGGTETRTCDLLVTGAGVPLAAGDTALVWWDETGRGARGVVLGRVGASSAVSRQPVDQRARGSVPETLLLEAKNELTIRVGGGSITMRKDGKILIKGRDLVSHAQRVNRIKGGSVAIN